MKFSKRCPKCDSTKIGHLSQVHDRKGSHAQTVPAVVGMAGQAGTFQGAPVRPGDLWGTLEAFVCTECGYFEQYVERPDKVPFEALAGFQWVNLDPEQRGPFR